MPGAFIAEKFGAKWVLAVGIFGGSICSLLSPLVASQLGLWWFVALRIFQGALQGPTSAVMFTLMGKWLPVKERSFLSSMIFNGNSAATIVTLALSGLLAENLGWQYIFYFVGASGGLIGICWIFFVHESPGHHPNIAEVILGDGIMFYGKTLCRKKKNGFTKGMMSLEKRFLALLTAKYLGPFMFGLWWRHF